MAKFIVLYTQPKDKEGFEKYYHEVHMPLVRDIPNIQRVSIDYVATRQNTNEDFYLIVELEFESLEVMQSSLSTEVGKRVQEDAKNIAPFLHEPPKILVTK